MDPASSTDHKRKGPFVLLNQRFKVVQRCMVVRTQSEVMIRRVQFLTRTKDAPTQAAITLSVRRGGKGYWNLAENL